MEQSINKTIRFYISILEPYEEKLPEEKKGFLNKLRQCLIILEKPLSQFTRAVNNDVKTSA
jgi:hypothetical protein